MEKGLERADLRARRGATFRVGASAHSFLLGNFVDAPKPGNLLRIRSRGAVYGGAGQNGEDPVRLPPWPDDGRGPAWSRRA